MMEKIQTCIRLFNVLKKSTQSVDKGDVDIDNIELIKYASIDEKYDED